MISANERIVKRPMSDVACLSPWIHMTARDVRSTGEGCVRKGLVPVTYWRKPELTAALEVHRLHGANRGTHHKQETCTQTSISQIQTRV